MTYIKAVRCSEDELNIGGRNRILNMVVKDLLQCFLYILYMREGVAEIEYPVG